MSSATITSAIKGRVAAVLTTYSELGYATDLKKNSFKGNFSRYGVLPLGSQEVSSVTRYVTLSQQFELILTDGFINTPMSDAQQQSKTIALQDLAFSVYKDLIATKCGAPATVIQVNSFQSSAPEYLTDDKVVIQKSTFNVTYRQGI
jgi:hypothetical protein